MNNCLYHVLFVDDDRDFLNSMQVLASTVLGNGNNGVELEPHFVNNPHDGLAFLQELTDEQEKTALIVSDQQMPQLSGVEFIERASKIVPNATKILLTGYASLESAKYAINNKILDHYVSKPIEDFDSFGAILTTAIKTFHYREEKEQGELEIQRYVLELERTNEKIRGLQRAAERIAYLAQGFKKLDWDDVLDLIVMKIPELFSAKYASLFLIDEDNKNLKMVRSNHLKGPFELPVTGANHGPMLSALAENKTIIIRSIRNAPYELLHKEYLGNSCIIIPFIIGFDDDPTSPREGVDGVKGVLNMGNVGDMMGDEIILYSAELIRNILGINILKAMLYRKTQTLAFIDGLTGLYNKKVFLELLNDECAYSERMGINLFMAFSDVDDFKTINDTYGHPVGDEVLRQIGQLYKKVVRNSDITSRFGGDEFVWLIKDTDASNVSSLLERFSAMVESSEFPHSIKPHMSTGLAQYLPGREDSGELLMARADKALYQAKAKGKSRVEVAIND